MGVYSKQACNIAPTIASNIVSFSSTDLYSAHHIHSCLSINTFEELPPSLQHHFYSSTQNVQDRHTKRPGAKPIQTPPNGGLVFVDAARIQFVWFYTSTYFLILMTQLSKILSNQAKTSLLIYPKAFLLRLD